ncbi:zinc-binding dehydrogenase [Paenibacillus solisilvae]|uniref:Zinc-binding dehydrogenase n=1 Tax=Paenibacillus solisilvae TaxID=2486751 RepID=A0ABW0VYY2_9BACL
MHDETMKALVYEGPRQMNIRRQAIPQLSVDEVLIRIEKVGICGSELSGYLGHNSLRKPPLIMGHEFSGVIARTGGGSSRFKEGDRVTANPLITCGICDYCKDGRAQLCPNRSLLGAHRPGAFAQYLAVPEKNVYLLDNHLSMEEGAFTEPFACAVHICRLLQLSPTDKLLILGAGPIGLFTLQAAQVYGLRDIVVVDLNRDRLEIVSELGAAAVTNLQELGDAGEASFHSAVDAVGMSVTRQQCVNAVKPGGKVIFTGLHEVDSNLPINTAIRNEIQMTGAFAYSPRDFEIALQWIREGRVNLLPWVHQAQLEEGGQCFEKLINGPGKIAKILLEIS